MSVQLPLTPDGLLQRQCNHCEAKFAVRGADTSDRILNWRCPTCGMVDRNETCYTHEQVAYAYALAENESRKQAGDQVGSEFSKIFGKNRRTGPVRVSGHVGPVDFGAVNVPSPFFTTQLSTATCSTCKRMFHHENAANPKCPFCRN